ncbi:MAG: cysteine desulfurase [Pseudomonadota bacterium]
MNTQTSVSDKQGNTQSEYDVERIRADFPILSRDVHGETLVYLDNGASAQKPKVVLDTVQKAYAEEYANVHRGLHYLSNTATNNYENARTTVARYLNAPSEKNIVFTGNATEAINLVAHSYGGKNISEGDEIVLSIMEHHSNIIPWHFYREKKGAVLKWVTLKEDGSFDLDAFEQALSPRTKMVALTHMSNVLGTVVPIKEVISLAHERGIRVLVDGSQSAVHMPIDVQDLDADFYVFTGHKVYGPSGIGVLYGKSDVLQDMPPFMGGGEMIETVACDSVTYAEPPYRFEAGTPQIVQAIGLGAALNYIMDIGRENIQAHESKIIAYAHERLGQIDGVQIFGTAPGKGSILSFSIDGIHAHDISTIIDRYGIAVRAGAHCAEPLMAHLGVTSTCRASFGMYNTMQDVDRLAEALEKAKTFF